MPLLDPHMSEKMRTLQLLDDAICYRLDRLHQSCPACCRDARCTEHAYDQRLILSYQDRYAAAFTDALAGMDPADIALIMQPGGDIPPTAGALSIAIMTRLRELSAHGPAVVELDGRTVVFEQDGPVLVEHPLTPESEH